MRTALADPRATKALQPWVCVRLAVDQHPETGQDFECVESSGRMSYRLKEIYYTLQGEGARSRMHVRRLLWSVREYSGPAERKKKPPLLPGAAD